MCENEITNFVEKRQNRPSEIRLSGVIQLQKHRTKSVLMGGGGGHKAFDGKQARAL